MGRVKADPDQGHYVPIGAVATAAKHAIETAYRAAVDAGELSENWKGDRVVSAAWARLYFQGAEQRRIEQRQAQEQYKAYLADRGAERHHDCEEAALPTYERVKRENAVHESYGPNGPSGALLLGNTRAATAAYRTAYAQAGAKWDAKRPEKTFEAWQARR